MLYGVAGRSDAGSGGDADFTERQTTEIQLCQTSHLFSHQECLAGHPLQRCRSDREAIDQHLRLCSSRLLTR